MDLSKEIFDVIFVLFPGFISLIIIEALIPNKNVEYKRAVVYGLLLSLLSFATVSGLWHILYMLSQWLNFGIEVLSVPNEVLFSSHDNGIFAICVFLISIFYGFYIAYIVNSQFVYRLMDKFYFSNVASDLEVWDDVFREPRENYYVVVRDMKNNLMYYGRVKLFSIAKTSEKLALSLTEVDVYENSSSRLLYNLNEIYIPFHSEHMTVEFLSF